MRSHASIVELAIDADVPNRDLVLDVQQELPFHGIVSGVTQDGRREFCAIVASSVFGTARVAPRRVVFVLDASSSMNGSRMIQARQAVLACLGALEAADCVGFVAFNDEPHVFADELRAANDETRDALRRHVTGIGASGGTELLAALQRALTILGPEGGDILLITDGEVSETEAITSALAGLPVRVNCLGIGDASQDRFLTHLARCTGGVSRYVTVRERVDAAVLELFASVGCAVAENVVVTVEPAEARAVIAPTPTARVINGRPLVVYGCCDACPDDATLLLSWVSEGDQARILLAFDAATPGDAETLRLARGARLISDVEAVLDTTQKKRRQRERVMRRLSSLAQEYGLANRAMALVAVIKRPDDEHGFVPHTTVVPVGMPADADFEAYFMSSAVGAKALKIARRITNIGMFTRAFGCVPVSHASVLVRDLLRRSQRVKDLDENEAMTVAAALQSDGGLPGKNIQTRVLITLVGALALHRYQQKTGQRTFTTHLERMRRFIRNNWGKFDPVLHDIVTLLLKAITDEMHVDGDWARLVLAHLEDPRVVSPEVVAQLEEAAERVAEHLTKRRADNAEQQV